MENKKAITSDEAMNRNGSMKNLIQLSFGEEVGNAITHGVMAVICLFLLPAVAIKAYLEGGVLQATGTSIFIISIFMMFLFCHLDILFPTLYNKTVHEMNISCSLSEGGEYGA